MMFTILSFVFGLGLLIAVHEYGHYRMAVACGVRVLRFSIGFGKPLFTWQPKGGTTEFVLAAIPLGGFVKMLDEREGPVDPALRHMAFNTQPLRNRALIVLAGPVANLLMAVCLYAAVGWWGVEQPKPVLSTPVPGSVADRAGLRAGDWIASSQVGSESPEVVESFDQLRWVITQAVLEGEDVVLAVSDSEAGPARRDIRLPLAELGAPELDAQLYQRIGLIAPFSAPRLGKILPDGAAAEAGLREGDWVHRVDNVQMADAQQLRERIRSASGANGQPLTQDWLVEREGRSISLQVSPKPERKDGAWIARIGAYVGGNPDMVVVRTDVVDSIWSGFVKTGETSLLTLKMMGKMLIGQASVKNLSGPLSIADHAGKSANHGLVPYLLFLAVISVSLGVLNLLPIPVLDGGHLMYYLYEAITGHEPSAVWVDRFQRGGMTFLMGMMSIALFNDVARLLG